MFWQMKNLIIHPSIEEKLKTKHGVSRRDVEHCFENKCGVNLVDTREGNKTDPPTLWFVSETNRGRKLKVVYICRDGNFYLKTAFDASEVDIDIYDRHGK